MKIAHINNTDFFKSKKNYQNVKANKIYECVVQIENKEKEGLEGERLDQNKKQRTYIQNGGMDM